MGGMPLPWPRAGALILLGSLAGVARGDTPLPMPAPDPSAAFAGSSLVNADSPAVAYEGRTAPGAFGSVRMGFPGVTCHVQFQGAGLALRADASNDNSMFDVFVDEAAPTILRLHGGTATYVLFTGPAGRHTVTLVRRNESWRGTCRLLGFLTTPDGQILRAPPLPRRRLMFIGDSVTCGELTAWQPGDDPKDGLHSDAYASYGMILARRLRAQCALVSYGGRGVTRDWQGKTDGTAPIFYPLALPDDPTARWSAARYVPDAVGIQLGTNDFNLGAPDKKLFVGAYAELVRQVLRDAPHARVFLMDSPIVTDDAAQGPRRTILHGYLEAVIAAVGSPRVVLVPLRHYPGVPHNGHPTGADHVGMANEIEPTLRGLLGWTLTAEPLG